MDSLRPPRHRLDRRALGWWTVQAAVFALPPVAVLALLTALIPPARTWLGLSLGVVAAIGLTYVLVMPTWRYRVHRWEATDGLVYAVSGWFWQRSRIAPVERIQTVDTSSGPLQRMFGLAGLVVTTASAAGPVRVQGLDRSLAAELAETLAARAQAVPGDGQ
ncbi:PH domain-containing protein [Paractinoplanes hotanensis]|uniref:PH domain-containing protein n=1 Tax=Paractinoplanes hotanensis TaxID=2906497 RepID=A0ABT0YF44_9ACTN|nr:PH domain-containing protein [Actinoplanes hotanensis]MCM4084138.1 PH domain-containing protein [Actinoplanes hotanensis]